MAPKKQKNPEKNTSETDNFQWADDDVELLIDVP